MTTAADMLELLKARDESNYGITTLIKSNTLYQRLLGCWANVSRLLPRDQQPCEVVPEGLELQFHLKWLWARIEPDPAPLWLSVAGLPVADHTLRAIEVLQDNAAVFPDGTMSRWSRLWLRNASGTELTDEEVEAAV